jgi:hypothetical protein
VRSFGAAVNYATGERRKIGRELIDRMSGNKVRVVAVEVSAIADLLADRFAAELREWLSPAQFAEMKAKNATPAYASGCCASADYCDSNMAMDAAFNAVLGRSLRGDDESTSGHAEDTALWNAAWEIARKNHIGTAA